MNTQEGVPAWVLFLPNDEQDYVLNLKAEVERLSSDNAVLRDEWNEWHTRAATAEARVEEQKQSIKTIVKEDGVVVSRQAKEIKRLRGALAEIADTFEIDWHEAQCIAREALEKKP